MYKLILDLSARWRQLLLYLENWTTWNIFVFGKVLHDIKSYLIMKFVVDSRVFRQIMLVSLKNSKLLYIDNQTLVNLNFCIFQIRTNSNSLADSGPYAPLCLPKFIRMSECLGNGYLAEDGRHKAIVCVKMMRHSSQIGRFGCVIWWIYYMYCSVILVLSWVID